jgi:hypothetical protein
MMLLGGTPVFSPDGSRLAAAEYRVHSESDFSLRIFDLNPTGATELMRRDYPVGGSIHRVERLRFDDAQTLWVDMTDGDRIHTVQIDIDSGEMTRILPEY